MKFHYVITIQFDRTVHRRVKRMTYTQNGHVEANNSMNRRELFETLCQDACRQSGASFGQASVLFYLVEPDAYS